MFSKVNRQLFNLARSSYSTYFIGFIFAYLSFAIPVKKVKNEKKILSFYHPRKYWDEHLLIVPKKRVPDFTALDLAQEEDKLIVQQIFSGAVDTASIAGLSNFTILVNGGAYQDVPQLHFHIGSGHDIQGNALATEEPNPEDLSEPPAFSTKHWKAHSVAEETPGFQMSFVSHLNFELNEGIEEITDLFKVVQDIVADNDFIGYSLMTNVRTNQGATSKIFSLVARFSDESIVQK